MTRSGEEYTASLRDGRSVILDGERVDDVRRTRRSRRRFGPWPGFTILLTIPRPGRL
jgi:hypothetical protein